MCFVSGEVWPRSMTLSLIPNYDGAFTVDFNSCRCSLSFPQYRLSSDLKLGQHAQGSFV